MRRLLPLLLLLSCADDPLTKLEGTLEITVINASDEAARVTARVLGPSEEEASLPVARPATVFLMEHLVAGLWDVRVDAKDEDGVPLQAVWVEGVDVKPFAVTRLLVDLSESPVPPPAEICNGIDDDGDGEIDELEDVALCAACDGGVEVQLEADGRCPAIACEATYEMRGDNTADGTSTCIAATSAPNGCAAIGRCGEGCAPAGEETIAEAGLCHTIASCGAEPSLELAADGTACAADRICASGECVPVDPPDPEIGCADGSREGFVSMAKYPSIAGCSGAWSLPGITTQLVPGCGRSAGNDAANAGGQGCAAVDLCATGWHVCDGKEEVALLSADGCQGAVPPGTPDKSLFFAVAQSSVQGSICTDDGTGDNDVFGCGNLGNALAADKNCGPLDRVLASTQPNSCGFNEAEPPLGPWECNGGAESHFHEGAIVTKKACASAECSYDGHPIGAWDKGGVLCCRE